MDWRKSLVLSGTLFWCTHVREARASLSDPFDAVCQYGQSVALSRVAKQAAEWHALHGELPSQLQLSSWLRREKLTFVWPRIWSARGKSRPGALNRANLAQSVAMKLSIKDKLLCGAATHAQGAHDVTTLVAVEPLMELSPVSAPALPGKWITFRGTVGDLIQTDRPLYLLVLPPKGVPRRMRVSLSASGAFQSKFFVASNGTYVFQWLAEDESGPRPIGEYELHVGEPTARSERLPQIESHSDDSAHALRVNSVRQEAGLSELRFDQTLAKIASKHAQSMMRASLLAHDTGAGDAMERLRDAGLSVRWIGENVARAKSEAQAFELLYASPSHRANMLNTRYRRIGVGIHIDKNNERWMSVIFAH